MIRLVPLDGAVPEPESLPLDMSKKKAEEKRFLDQLASIKNVEEYEVKVDITVKLRPYQKEGINWLAFLSR